MHASVELFDVFADTGERKKAKTSAIPPKTWRKTATEQRPKQRDISAVTAVITAAEQRAVFPFALILAARVRRFSRAQRAAGARRRPNPAPAELTAA
jgi:hypothetical protein